MDLITNIPLAGFGYSDQRFQPHGNKQKMIHNTWPAALASLEPIQAFIAEHVNQAGLDIHSYPSLSLIVEEIIVNIITHAYKNTDAGPITIELKILPESICISFSDRGHPFDPLALEPPDITKNIEERDIGGLGLFMVRQMADEINYQRYHDENLLTITLRSQKET